MIRKVYLHTETETKNFAKEFAASLNMGDIILLKGELGAGKTTFVRGLVEGLGGNPMEVISPTFSLLEEYKIRNGMLLHGDFYRLDKYEDLDDLGGAEIFYEKKIFCIEWPEKIQIADFIKKKNIITITIQIEKDSRALEIK